MRQTLRIQSIATAAVLAMAAPAVAQSEEGGSRSAPTRYAIPRAEAPQRAAPPARTAPAQRSEPVRVAPPARAAAAQGQAVPRGGRPQGDNPRTGTAVPRGARPSPPVVDRGGARTPSGGRRMVVPNRGRTVIVRPPIYNNYYYYPRRYYPYGYGSFGLGYFYYDPYRWYPSGFYGGHYQSQRSYAYDIGELRLRVSPRHAQVFVDGYYAGVVNDYDGVLQALKLESGPYRIEIVAPGYEPLEFDIRILPGQKITYRGDLLPLR